MNVNSLSYSRNLYVLMLGGRKKCNFLFVSRSPETAVVPIRVAQTASLTLTVKTMTGRNYFVTVPSAGGVIDLMRKIEDLDGMPVNEQRLLFLGLTLEKERTLAFYKIKDKDVFHSVRRQMGGRVQ